MVYKFSRILIELLNLVLVSPFSYSQVEIAARIVDTVGRVEVVRANGDREILRRRDAISVGDTVVTPEDGAVQLRFVDSALVALGCASELRVNSYSYQQTNVNQAELILLAGNLRTISGQIEPEKYRLKIADTVVLSNDGDFELAIAPDDTQYFAVYDGATTIINSQNQSQMKLGAGANADFGKLEPGFQFEELIQYPAILGLSILNITDCRN